MTRISMQELKRTLSKALAAAEAGATVVITRDDTPVAKLTPVAAAHTHRGSRVGTDRLAPAIRGGLRGSTGLLMATLLADRGDR